MKIGFTGTQKGMTPKQKEAVVSFLHKCPPDRVHHGDCIGADAEFDKLVHLNFPKCLVIIHPPVDEGKRANCFTEGDVVFKPAPYLKRNQHIVDLTDFLIATPKGVKEEVRSGTWATVRYARKKGKQIVIIWPDGTEEIQKKHY